MVQTSRNKVASPRIQTSVEFKCSKDHKERCCLSFRREYKRQFCAFFIFLSVFSVTSAGNCSTSVHKMRVVTECPTNQKMWEKRAKAFNCSVQKTCSISSNLAYHCILNAYQQILLEVCAKVQHCRGFCPEYNLVGKRIQDNYKVNCTTHKPPCPRAFMSYEVFKYPSCFKINNTEKTNSTQIGTETDGDVNKVDKLWIPITSTVSVIVFASILMVSILCLRKKIKRRFPSDWLDKRHVSSARREVLKLKAVTDEIPPDFMDTVKTVLMKNGPEKMHKC